MRSKKPTPPDSDGGSAFRIALALREINALVASRVAAELEPTGLTMPQITALMLIAHAGSPTMSELCAGMNASPSTVAGIVDRLEAAGIVARNRDEADRRSVRVSIAPAGSRQAALARGAVPATDLARIEDGLAAALAALRLAPTESRVDHGAR
jgi:DNA-binding MarR family transcriptional regulator